jgi:hypothetical protein
MHLRLRSVCVALFLVALCLPRTPAVADESQEAIILISYGIPDLPVWRVDSEGKPHFDASVVVAHIKLVTGPEIWEGGRFITAVNEGNGPALIVGQTDAGHDLVSGAYRQIAAFADHDVAARLAKNLKWASDASQRVLVFTSAPDSRWTKQFFAAQDSEADDHAVFADFVVQCATPEQAKRLADKGIVSSPESGASLAILEADGTLLGQLDLPLDDATEAAVHSRLIEFLTAHQVKFANAKQTLDEALAQAAAEDKRVLIQMSGPNCRPCILLSQLLTRHDDLLSKDYVYAKLDMRMPGAKQTKKTYGADFQTIPWLAIVSKEGELLVSSQGPEGNIAYPRGEVAKAHFKKMLQSTSQRLTEEEVTTILNAIE